MRRSAKLLRSGTPLVRDRSKLVPALSRDRSRLWRLERSPLSRGQVWNGPGSAAHHQEVLRCARDTCETIVRVTTLADHRDGLDFDQRIRVGQMRYGNGRAGGKIFAEDFSP